MYVANPTTVLRPMSDAAEQFRRLQRNLLPLWPSIAGHSREPQTVVVLPSLTVDFELGPVESRAYEERLLSMLFLLRQPSIHLVYVTSQAIDPAVIDYYLSHLPPPLAKDARRRLSLLSPRDDSSAPLVEKILQRPAFLRRLRNQIPDPRRAHLVPFITTVLERELALLLGIPIFGADPALQHYGSKSGSRRLFAESGVAHPLGYEDLSSTEDVIGAIAAMRRQRSDIRRVLVKLNEGVSGDGNAALDLSGLPQRGDIAENDAIAAALLRDLRPESGNSPAEFLQRLARHGGIVEQRIEGEEILSPSVQMRVTPLGELEIVSTHDQLLGGNEGQRFEGCRFPADPAYASSIIREAKKVGERLATAGVIGRFAVDFVVARTGGSWQPYAIEVNLRKGGTTHPYLALELLTDGRFNADENRFATSRGKPKFYVASDYVSSPTYRRLSYEDLHALAHRHRLSFDHHGQRGVVFHMLSAMAPRGRLGLTAIGDSADEAATVYQRTIEALNNAAAAKCWRRLAREPRRHVAPSIDASLLPAVVSHA